MRISRRVSNFTGYGRLTVLHRNLVDDKHQSSISHKDASSTCERSIDFDFTRNDDLLPSSPDMIR